MKCFAEIPGDKQMNLMLNELIKKVKRLKLLFAETNQD